MTEWTPEVRARLDRATARGTYHGKQVRDNDLRAALAEIDRLTAKLKRLENVPLHTTQPQQPASEGKEPRGSAAAAVAEEWRRFAEGKELAMTDEQIKHMVSRFLAWRLPENFNPDCGISFKPTYGENTGHEGRYEPTGTNLFNATQAEAMVRHMLGGRLEGRHFDDGDHAVSVVGGAASTPSDFGAVSDVDALVKEWRTLTKRVYSHGQIAAMFDCGDRLATALERSRDGAADSLCQRTSRADAAASRSHS